MYIHVHVHNYIVDSNKRPANSDPDGCVCMRWLCLGLKGFEAQLFSSLGIAHGACTCIYIYAKFRKSNSILYTVHVHVCFPVVAWP